MSLAWQDLFSKIMQENTKDRAREVFFKQAQDILLEVAAFHEIGHIIADSEGVSFKNDKKSEVVALLNELAFGPLTYESLNTTLSFAWRGQWEIYRYAGQYVLKDFIEKIKENYFADDLRIEYKGPRSNTLLAQQNILYYLNRQQIREFAEDRIKEIVIDSN